MKKYDFDPRDYIIVKNGWQNVDWNKLRAEFNSDHECSKVERITRRELSNGRIAYYLQCPLCGNGRAVKNSQATGATYPAWRDDLQSRRRDEYNRLCDLVRAEIEKDRQNKTTDWWKWYNTYLQTTEWHAIRDKVLKRCNNWCEGCDRRPAVHVHHLTYDHVGNELLFELVGVCQFCHDRIHAS